MEATFEQRLPVLSTNDKFLTSIVLQLEQAAKFVLCISADTCITLAHGRWVQDAYHLHSTRTVCKDIGWFNILEAAKRQTALIGSAARRDAKQINCTVLVQPLRVLHRVHRKLMSCCLSVGTILFPDSIVHFYRLRHTKRKNVLTQAKPPYVDVAGLPISRHLAESAGQALQAKPVIRSFLRDADQWDRAGTLCRAREITVRNKKIGKPWLKAVLGR
ncbi:hypothetical protein KCU83_g442, partial [Aureobasidium melanogenum]